MAFELREDIEGGKNMWLDTIGDVEQEVFYAFAAITALVFVLSLTIIILSCIFRHVSPGFSMDFYIAVGSMVLTAHVLMLGLHEDWGDGDQYNALCQVAPAVLLLGWMCILGGILFKTWAFVHYFTLGKNKTVRQSEWIPNFGVVILMMIMAALVIIWAIEYPLYIKEEIQFEMDDGVNKTVTQLWVCEGEKMKEWKIATSATLGVVILSAALLVWVALHVSRKDSRSGEASSLCLLVYNTLLAIAAGTLVYLFYDDDRHIMYAIIGGLHFYAILVAEILVIVIKIKSARRHYNSENSQYEDMDDESKRSSAVNPAMEGADRSSDFNY